MYRMALSAAVFLLLLAGCAAKKTPPPLADIHGTVLLDRTTPYPGARVLIEGHPLATTDADGKFTVTDVELPYRTVIEMGSTSFIVYDGLTTALPTFGPPFAVRGALLKGEVQGAAGGRDLAVSLASPAALGYDDLPPTIDPGPRLYSIDAKMLTPSATGRVYALEWTRDASGKVDAFTGYGTTAELFLADGDHLTGLDITLDPLPAAHDLQVSASAPSDYDVLGVITGVRPWPEDQLGLSLLTGFAPPPFPATVRAPHIPGARMMLELFVAEPGGSDIAGISWTSVPVIAPSASLTFPVPRPQPLGPADGATGVGAGGELSWTTSAGSLSMLQLTGDVMIFAYTNEPRFTLPDLSAFGADYGSAAVYTWKVYEFGLEGLTSTDALLESREAPQSGLLYALLAGKIFNERGGYFVTTPERTFTTP